MVIVILGPTCVGKTKMGVLLAKKYNGEVINCDSTQVYKGLDIATAKVTLEEMDGVIHHLLDFKDINEEYSVFDFQKDCRMCIEDIISRGKTPIIVGGTGLYIKAALYDYNFSEDNITYDYSEYSNLELYNRLLDIDPNTKIHINNRKRVERALSYYDSTGNIISENRTDKLMYDSLFIGLTTTREILYERINNRVYNMIDNGLLEEAKKIYDLGIRSKAVMTPIGYKELFPYFEGNIKLEESIMNIQQNSRRYAKRQYTWFNNQMDVKWFDVDFECFNNTYYEVCKYIENEKR
jgi:tRNA dimethylallyltransferase